MALQVQLLLAAKLVQVEPLETTKITSGSTRWTGLFEDLLEVADVGIAPVL